ncbi:MAG: (deoxy)nucleoside triphosphate pyrophosphohydrolase [Megasphaera sp.]|jgi:8-oxo-dGTP diphosphatase|nr:(deoxy)nucleoside triphosphate pyrophosphohydrolase [Megasphaera sp.]MCH4188367.1 (deoxy)nucleoside triphosphate pyrophosphohydrolase [Megasphaera sp.]MCH4218206.1 (deoxy)nucleoside triphosphate pyrophosphohydrolase [Megasphaera sp.]
MMKHLEVVAAVLKYDGKILCMERGKGKYEYVSFKYEFPGGKIEPGEAKHEAIERELREEMDVHVTVQEEDLYMTVRHMYPDFSITMYAFLCQLDSPDFVRKEHVAAKWLLPHELPTLDWAPADVPIMEKLAKK